MIRLRNITFKYRNETVLKSISFRVEKGEKIVLLGINGSGKSTLLKILNGLIFPEKGEYYYKNTKITQKKLKDKEFSKSFRKEVALLFQNPDSMLFNPTVYDEIAFGLRQLGEDESKVKEKVKQWAEILGIHEKLEHIPFELSGGEKQKVCLASLLILDPEVLLLDEPTANLDPRTTGWFIDFLQELNKTAIITTHNLDLAAEMADRAVVLSEDHTVIYDGKLEEFLKDTDKLLEANLIHKHRHRHKNIIHTHFHTHWNFD